MYTKESEFGKRIVEILHRLGFETWQEVYLSRKHCVSTPCVDIIAKLGKIYFAFELKLTLNDDVLDQAQYNRKFVDYSYVVVPPRKKVNVSSVKEYYIKHHNIGVIFADPEVFKPNFSINNEDKILKKIFQTKVLKFRSYARIFNSLLGFEIIFPAKRVFRKHKFVKGIYKGKYDIETFLFKEQKKSIAGSAATTERSTPFKRSCARIYAYLQKNPHYTKKQVWAVLSTKLHWKTYNSMCSSFRQYGSLDVMKKIVWRKK